MTVLVGTNADPVRILGVHGGHGELQWKCFVRLHMTHAPIAGFEFVRVPVGTSIGRHRHSRTEEIYFVLSGRGLMDQDGVRTEIGPGDLIMSRRDVTHAMDVLDDEAVELLVIEIYPPDVLERLPAHSPEADGEGS
jgi:mannose-6-phosphate isomerase-like protein (cupin superfamily)